MLTVVPDGCPSREGGKGASPSLIDEIARRGGDGCRLVVRTGCRQGREVLTSAGAVEVTAPGSAHPGAKKARAEILIESPEPAAA